MTLFSVMLTLFLKANGFTEIRQRLEFHLDFTGHTCLIGQPYQKIITADRALQKYNSLGMYQYYAIMSALAQAPASYINRLGN